MALPEFARDMKVPVNQRDHVIDSGALAWVFCERRDQLGNLTPVIRIARRKEVRKKPSNGLFISRRVWGGHMPDTLMGRAFTACRPLLVHRIVPLLTGFGRLVHLRVSPGSRQSTQ